MPLDASLPVAVAKLQENGCELASQQDFEGALRCFEEAIQAEPGHAVLQELKAQSLLALERFPLALQSARTATQLSPTVSHKTGSLCKCTMIGIANLHLVQACMWDHDVSEGCVGRSAVVIGRDLSCILTGIGHACLLIKFV